MSTTTPTQFLLPGQAAAPAGPIDMNHMYVMHHGFRRDLMRFVEAAQGTPVSARDTWRALARRWELFALLLHHHHSGEDATLWPALEARADEAGLATLAAMEAEHGEIDPLLAACSQGFTRLADVADDDARRALSVRLVATRERLGAHLRHEETEAIELIQAVLTPQEWHEIDEVFRKEMTFALVLQMVPWALSGLTDDVRHELFTQPGGAGYRVVAALTCRRFERQERRTFRYIPASD